MANFVTLSTRQPHAPDAKGKASPKSIGQPHPSDVDGKASPIQCESLRCTIRPEGQTFCAHFEKQMSTYFSLTNQIPHKFDCRGYGLTQ